MSSPELTITVQDDRTVRADTQGGGHKPGQVDCDDLRRATIGVFEEWLRRGQITRRKELEVLGTHLYEILFRGDLGAFFEKELGKVPSGDRLRLQLSFEKEAYDLAALPWEYLYKPDSATSPGFFLSTHVDLVLSRFMPLEGERRTIQPGKGPLRILIVVSQPTDPDLGAVVPEPVIEQIRKLQNVQIDALDKPTIANFLGRLETLRDQQEELHVLHFIGHGRYNLGERRGEIALLKEDDKAEWISDTQFTDYFRQTRVKPRLIFLHLCESATIDFTANFAGLAPQLIRAGISAAVAMQYPITNQAAISFGRAFYREVAKGKPIDHAVQVGRWRITTEDPHAYDSRVFGTPVLYMHSSDGIIMPAAEGPVPGPEQRPPTPAQPVRVGGQAGS